MARRPDGEMVYTTGLSPVELAHKGSSPFSATKNFVILHLWNLDTKLSIIFSILESVEI